jgi:uncharacterized membrane protein
MSVLLILLMVTNLLAGIVIVPALIVWMRPRFILKCTELGLAARREANGLTRAASS